MKKYIYCSCGEIVGEEKLERIDNNLQNWGIGNGKVYKVVWNGKEARQKIGNSDNMLVPLKNNMYMCKKCWGGKK